jgi:5-enolpyruvylshikimate-3-phosphate synthase
MGVRIETTDGHAPIAIVGAHPLRAMHLELPVASAQVLGAVGLAALAADGETTIAVPGPTRDHTERLLGWLGAPVTRDGLDYLTRGQGLADLGRTGGPYCRSCGTRNDATASYCDSCGKPLA